MWQLLLMEKRTLFKGFLICLIVVFPFTFLPLIGGEEAFWESFVQRLPLSILYSFVGATFICLAALYHNYERQSIKLRMFAKPAFKALGFDYVPTGTGSLVDDLGFYLLGSHNEFRYIIDMEISLDDHEQQEVILSPLIYAPDNAKQDGFIKAYKVMLDREFKFTSNQNHLEIILSLKEIQVEDPLAVTKLMNRLEAKLKIQPAV